MKFPTIPQCLITLPSFSPTVKGKSAVRFFRISIKDRLPSVSSESCCRDRVCRRENSARTKAASKSEARWSATLSPCTQRAVSRLVEGCGMRTAAYGSLAAAVQARADGSHGVALLSHRRVLFLRVQFISRAVRPPMHVHLHMHGRRHRDENGEVEGGTGMKRRGAEARISPCKANLFAGTETEYCRDRVLRPENNVIPRGPLNFRLRG